MKRIAMVSVALALCYSAWAQRTIQLKNLWADPQVHVIFNGYTVSFTIKDINRAITLLTETGDSSFGLKCGLDTAKQYAIELYAGYNTEYRDRLQQLLQKGIGAFLLVSGHAEIESRKHKKLKAVVADAQPYEDGSAKISDVKFYDPHSGKLLFNGLLSADMAHQDIGIE